MKEERQNALLDVIETYLNGNIIKKFQYSDSRILNAFHDYNRVQFDEVKTILINNFLYE